MKINIKTSPREFKVGLKQIVIMKDMGTISLFDDEQITFF